MKLAVRVAGLLVLLAIPVSIMAAPSDLPSHLNKQKLRYGCGSCHSGFGFRAGGGMNGCLNCHGAPAKRVQGLFSATIDLPDIEAEFKKTYRHPTFEIRGVHNSKEKLPEVDPRAPRHSDCVDCHDPHQASSVNKYSAAIVKRGSSGVVEYPKEYSLCYKCHSESANLPPRSINKKTEFSLNNPSYHPVEGEGRNLTVISLLRPYKEKKVAVSDISTISCSDCHGSDRASSARGPHGSNFQFILVDNYSIKDAEIESNYAYALCYRCHSRSSILSDESFKFHSLHIRGKGGNGGTSCYTCHSSHGSTENKYLIRFNTDVVTANSNAMLKFVEKGVSTFRGECYLSCHGVDHNPKSY